MAKFSSGKYAQFISDRSGFAFPYQEMVVEWTGARVHTSEFEPKSPQVSPKPHGADPQALEHARPRSPSIPSPGILPADPFTTAVGSTSVTVSLDNTTLQVNDFVSFLDFTANSIGGIPKQKFSPETTLQTTISATDTTLTCVDSTNFPSDGYVLIQSPTQPSATDPNYVPVIQYEVIKYTTNTTLTGVLSGLTRGTNAPFRGETPPLTTANQHLAGAKIFGAFKISSITTTTKNNPGEPPQITVNTGFTVPVIIASTAETGGGQNVYFSPVGRGIV